MVVSRNPSSISTHFSIEPKEAAGLFHATFCFHILALQRDLPVGRLKCIIPVRIVANATVRKIDFLSISKSLCINTVIIPSIASHHIRISSRSTLYWRRFLRKFG
jgi:hypothetical protein